MPQSVTKEREICICHGYKLLSNSSATKSFLIRSYANVTKRHTTAGQALESIVIIKRLKRKSALATDCYRSI